MNLEFPFRSSVCPHFRSLRQALAGSKGPRKGPESARKFRESVRNQPQKSLESAPPSHSPPRHGRGRASRSRGRGRREGWREGERRGEARGLEGESARRARNRPEIARIGLLESVGEGARIGPESRESVRNRSIIRLELGWNRTLSSAFAEVGLSGHDVGPSGPKCSRRGPRRRARCRARRAPFQTLRTPSGPEGPPFRTRRALFRARRSCVPPRGACAMF